MLERYREREFAVSCEAVLDYGESLPHVEWTVRVDGDVIPSMALHPSTWTLQGVAQAVRGYIDRQIDGVAA